MSSEKRVRIPFAENPKGSYTMLVNVGLSGPKLSPKGVSDGKSVNIPIPTIERDGRTHRAM